MGWGSSESGTPPRYPVTIGTLQSMSECANCGATMQQRWRFCIHCGTPVGAAVAAPTTAPFIDHSPTVITAVIPGAARAPVGPDAPAGRRRVDIPMIAGIALGAAGIALIIYMIVVLGG